MPLIETVTGADLRTPDEVEEAILLVGRVCRSTRHVRVGMGASRQDVNVSVRGGRRVEIKGVPQARLGPWLVHGEARAAGEPAEAARRAASAWLPDSRRRPVGDDRRDRARGLVVPRPRCGRRRGSGSSARAGGRLRAGPGPFRVLAMRLPGLGGTLAWPTQPGGRSPTKLAGRVRSIAGLDSGADPVPLRGPGRERGRDLAWLRAAAGARRRTASSSSGDRNATVPRRRTRSACATWTRRRHPQRDTPAFRRTARPTSSGSCPGLTTCIPTPTRRRRGRRASASVVFATGAANGHGSARRATSRPGSVPVVHYLVRRGGREPRGPRGGRGGRRPVKQACLLVGEAAEGAAAGRGRRWTAIPEDARGASSFQAAAVTRPVLSAGVGDPIVRRMAAAPSRAGRCAPRLSWGSDGPSMARRLVRGDARPAAARRSGRPTAAARAGRPSASR